MKTSVVSAPENPNDMKIAPIRCFLLRASCALALLYAAASPAHAVKFTGDAGTAWSNGANWEGGEAPIGGGTVEITDAVVDLDVPVSVSGVTLSNGTIRGAGGSLTVTGQLQIASGGFFSGTPTVVNIPSSGTVKWSGGSFTNNFTLNNSGVIEWSGGPVFFDGVLNNSATGSFVIIGDHGFGTTQRAGVINNAGRIVKQTGNGVSQFSGFTAETNQINTTLNNTGTVEVASGTLEIGSGTSSGNFIIAAGKTLLVQGNGPHTFDQATFTGAGKCSFGGNATFLGEINSSVEIELLGEITGGDTEQPQGSLTGTGELVWKSGAIVGAFTIGEGVRTTLTGPAVKSYRGSLVNQGTMDWAGPGPLATNDSTFRNEGTFNVLAAGTFLADLHINGQTFENVGTLNTFPGGTSQTDDTLIVNAGTVNIGGYGSAGILTTRLLQTSTGSLQMEIGGASADAPEFDQLRGPATLDGALTVDVINGYVPPTDARFTLVASHDGKFARVFTAGGTDRFAIEYPGNSRTDLVSLTDAPVPSRLWGAGRDLARNEVPDRDAELPATNARFPQWSYGYRSTAGGTNLTPFTPEQHINDGTGLHGWIANGQATLAVNTKNTPIVFNTGSGDYKPLYPDQIYMAPGSGNEFLVVRWTAPEAGDYRVIARWLDLDQYGGNGVTAHVILNGQEEFAETLASTATAAGRARLRARTFSLNAGDVLDFVVGSNGENGFDATAFNAAVRRVPKVTITTPASNLTVPEGQDVTIEAAIDHTGPIAEVILDIDGETVAKKLSPPYSFVHQFEPGTHYVRVIANDERKAPGASAPLEVTVTPAGATSLARKGASKAATSSGKYYTAVESGGYWQNPTTWSPQGVPGEEDCVMIGSGTDVLISEFEIARELHLLGRIVQVGSGGSDVGLAVNKHLAITGGEVIGLAGGPRFTFRTSTRAKAFICLKPAVFRDIDLDFNGKLTIVGGGVVSSGSSFTNSGRVIVTAEPATENRVSAGFERYEQKGGVTALGPSTLLNAPGVQLAGTLQLSPGYVIARDGASVIARDGASVIARDGASLVGLDGGSLVGNDGSTLIGNDGGTLVGLDGGSLVGLDGGSVIARDGASFIKNSAAGMSAPQARRSAASDGVSAEAAESGSIVLAGGIVSGTGELRGSVINQSSYLSPGASAGTVVVNGDYTQEAGGTLLLEIGGKDFATGYDAFAVGGVATLGGNLIVKTIDGFTPAEGDSFTPLLYASAKGSFANISSNAQVTLDADSMTLKVSGPNPPGPKALNIATRMRVETGDNVLIAGFIITGDQPKKVLVRGIGPSLPVDGALADPTLDLDDGAFTNDNWKSDQQGEIEATTIPPTSEVEAAIVATLEPGAHTAVLRGKNDGTGVGLVEVYDLESGSPVQLANISTRGQVQTGDNVMIGGFIIGGSYPAKVLVRAIGPSLPVDGALQDPTLELVDSNGATVSNDNWRATQESEIIATTVPPTNDREAAIVATLVPGAYTAIVRGKDDTIGVALVEGYNLQ